MPHLNQLLELMHRLSLSENLNLQDLCILQVPVGLCGVAGVAAASMGHNVNRSGQGHAASVISQVQVVLGVVEIQGFVQVSLM